MSSCPRRRALVAVNQGLQFASEFHINFARTLFDDEAAAEFRMIDAVTHFETRLDGIVARRAGVLFEFGERLARRRTRGAARARRSRFFGGNLFFAVHVIRAAGATLHAAHCAIGFERGDDVFAGFFATSAKDFNVITEFELFYDSERVLHVGKYQ